MYRHYMENSVMRNVMTGITENAKGEGFMIHKF